jgi:very-short-patch-repair endonuclease
MRQKSATRGDPAVARIAGGQHGVVSLSQLAASGIGTSAIARRVRSGRLHRIHRGVYAVGHRATGIEARWMAATLAGGPAAVLSHRSAGRLWGLLPGGGAAPEVTRPGRCGSRPGLVTREGSLPPDEITVQRGIPVTSVSRTLFDLAAIVSSDRLGRAVNQAEVLGLTSRLSLPALVERYPGRRGNATLRNLLRDREPARGVARNRFEQRFRALLEASELPLPRFNADLAVAGRFLEVDCLWAAQRLIVELDGRAVHGTRRAFEADRERDRLLVADGWRVVRVTWAQVHGEPANLLADLRAILAAYP